jgi:hypothetical protein
MTHLIEIDGTDTTGKTTVGRQLCARLTAQNVTAQLVPSARKLVPGFASRFQECSAHELVELELEGYRARCDWAANQESGIYVIDRGLQTLLSSSAARLIQSGTDEEDGWAHVARVQQDLKVQPQADARYLLTYRELPAAEAVAVFLRRESEHVSPAYKAYQATFMRIMRQQAANTWDAVFSATATLEQTCERITAEVIEQTYTPQLNCVARANHHLGRIYADHIRL